MFLSIFEYWNANTPFTVKREKKSQENGKLFSYPVEQRPVFIIRFCLVVTPVVLQRAIFYAHTAVLIKIWILQELMHQSHFVCLVSHLRLVNTVLCDEVLRAAALSIIPSAHAHIQKQVTLMSLTAMGKWTLLVTQY